MTKYFYGRVSTLEQNLASQQHIAELADIPKENQYLDKASGRNTDRPELKKCLSKLSEGDVLTITRLDRLARSTADLLGIVQSIESRGAYLEVLEQPEISTINSKGKPSSAAKLMLGMLAVIAEFEINLSKERQVEGIARAKEEGKYKGRKSRYSQIQKENIYDSSVRRGISSSSLAKAYGCSARQINRIIKEMELLKEESKLAD